MSDRLDPAVRQMRLDEVTATLERTRAERDLLTAALLTVRRALTREDLLPIDVLLREVIDPALDVVAGRHPSAAPRAD